MSNGNYASTSHKPYEGEMYTDEQLALLTAMTDTRDDFERHFKPTIRQQKRHTTGSYRDPLTQARWEGWMAALSIALDKVSDIDTSDDASGAAIEKAMAAIRAIQQAG